MEPPSANLILTVLNPSFSTGQIPEAFAYLCFMAICIFLVAIFSSSENALFSLSIQQIDELTDAENKRANAIRFLINHPKKLLATILIANTFVTVTMVMISNLFLHLVFDMLHNPLFGFLLEVVLVTFIIVFVGEVIPKIYSAQNNMRVSRMLAVPMFRLFQVVRPLVYFLEHSTSIIDKRITRKGHILTVDELTHAIDITSEHNAPRQEKNILKGIVNFGNISVRQIMRQRSDICSVDVQTAFLALKNQIMELEYSRLPVFEDSNDHILGILATKDLIPHLQMDTYDWQQHIREPFFVPETKKIDDLLKAFQEKRVHMALAVNEFGELTGLVTLEDIIEEVFGEIQDEFDDEESKLFVQLSDGEYLFEAKTPLLDFCKQMNCSLEDLDEFAEDADTLGGFILNLNGSLPRKGQKINWKNFQFIIDSADRRRMLKIKVKYENE